MQDADLHRFGRLANRLGQTIDAGDANAAFRLAELYRSGEKQVPLDLAKALYLYNTVGSIDLKQDYKQALKWYSKADSLGNVDALNNLGYLHDEGLGTPRDQAKPGAAEKVTTITKLMQGGKK